MKDTRNPSLLQAGKAGLVSGTVLLVALLAASSSALDAPSLEHPAGACGFPSHVQGAGWDLCWQQDGGRGQGLELNQVYFHGESVIWKIGVPFSITHYDNHVEGPFKDMLGRGGDANPGFGRGAMQIHPADCPRFFGDGHLRGDLQDRSLCVETRGGPDPAIAVWARYDVFNYRFLQGYFLTSGGTMEPFVGLGGALIDAPLGADGANHIHHLYWRVDFDIGGPGRDEFQMYLRPDEAMGPYGDLNDVPHHCRHDVRAGEIGWCTIHNETALMNHHALLTKWRVKDPVTTNPLDRARSYEASPHSDAPPDGAFTSFDVLALQRQGDSQEIGFEVPPRPWEGDAYLEEYFDPAEPIDDPVVWFAVNAYHDTRDEDTPSMNHHYMSFKIKPRNFLGENPGEDSFDPRPIVDVPENIQRLLD